MEGVSAHWLNNVQFLPRKNCIYITLSGLVSRLSAYISVMYHIQHMERGGSSMISTETVSSGGIFVGGYLYLSTDLSPLPPALTEEKK